MAQNVNKLCPSCLYISETIETIGMIFISSTPVQKDNIPRFFYFFSKFFFGLNSGVKGQKMAPNNKNLCLSHSLSQEACIIWSLFLVPVCKMISLPEAFFIFSKFLFSRLLEVKRARNSPKWQKILVVSLSISRTVPHWYTCVKWWYIQQLFSFFQNSHFLIIFRGVGE